MYVPNLTHFQHSHLEKCGFLTRGVNKCCTRCTENTLITKIDFHREKWCGNKCTKFERKRLYRCEDVLLSVTCNFYSDKIITPKARFCWTLSHIYICYKNASRLNRYIFRTVNAINFLFSALYTTPFPYDKIHFGVLHLLRASIATFDTSPGSNPP